MVALSLSLLDDKFFFGRKNSSSVWSLLEKAANVLIYAALVAGIVKLYALEVNGSIIESHIGM